MADIFDTIKKFAADVTTLDVLTLTGTLKLVPTPADPATGATGAKELKWDDYFKGVVEKFQTPDDDSKLEIAAYTHAELDSDSVNFYSEGGADDALRQLHLKTVESATKARLEAVAAFARVIKGIA